MTLAVSSAIFFVTMTMKEKIEKQGQKEIDEKNAAPSWLAPIQKANLSKLVVDKIKEGIINKTLNPGDFLPSENELSEKIGVGKSSVREAVKMLEAIGVVKIKKGYGSQIVDSIDSSVLNPLVFQLLLINSTESRQKLLEFRIMFEISGSMLAIDNAVDSDIELLKNNLDATKNAFAQKIPTIEFDKRFHMIIYESTHNSFIAYIGKTIMELFHNTLITSNTKYPETVIADHEKILGALIARDKQAIKDAIEKSLDKWYIYSLEK